MLAWRIDCAQPDTCWWRWRRIRGPGRRRRCSIWRPTLLRTSVRLRWSRISHARGNGTSASTIFGLTSPWQPGTAAMADYFSCYSLDSAFCSRADFLGNSISLKLRWISKLVWLTVLGLLNSAVAAGALLRIQKAGYVELGSRSRKITVYIGPLSGRRYCLRSAVATLLLGIFPSLRVLDFATCAAALK